MCSLALRQVLRVWHFSRSQRVRALHRSCACAAHRSCLLRWLVHSGRQDVCVSCCCGARSDGLCAFSCNSLHRWPRSAALASFCHSPARSSLAHAMSWSGCCRNAHRVLALSFQPLPHWPRVRRPVLWLRAAEGFWFRRTLSWFLCSRALRRLNSALSREQQPDARGSNSISYRA